MAYLWATYIVPETANVSLEMIDEVFRSPASQEDIVVKRQVRTVHPFNFSRFGVSSDSRLSGGTRPWFARANA
jgi:hypothetical protein